ncbi:bifunctional 4-hydroxy-2-oxoglutarate aldolase/2-dehydro-3-deoxy-phosphogluconate aldolase [Rhodovulum sp. 12E13]|uniref:bifunctional 4-hydroxy-2-oxoglutarate aldolase/2-dehydro-3-deoxy-phosphogluconate aldolase n=1 Tax=Rhodovulum sp. 12E13 TaxID=2203891 RepID=UPI000E18CB03|nr:bifunctional 4-hydroxy-2-oxoglutarate aldolase/2-dehydro-3-deoxy-phosphogluconate aldolase [Rhodovulum sp. 12E13]RDC72573.1 bifunctional 4-hydroxy-2-oxoglutarate aldolase/2-dehydro-3-deoxy-phosphogluconate aldolase [Rhodovulum sp. 12E13]
MDTFAELGRHGVVPVIEIDDAAHALPLADALAAGGLPVAEITFRTPAARDAIAAVAAQRPDMLVGAGTVLTPAQVDAAREAGARYGLAPGLNRAVRARAAEAGLPFAPGVMTPSEIEQALEAGCAMVKFFPAMAAGGPAMLKAIAGPYAHTGIGFNPTGGVTLDTLKDWLALPQVRAVGGTWIASRADIAAERWEAIAENARAAVDRVARVRAG